MGNQTYRPDEYGTNGNQNRPYSEESHNPQYGEKVPYMESYESYEEQEMYGNSYVPPVYTKSRPPEKKNTLLIVLICILSFIILAGAAFITVWMLMMRNEKNKKEEKPTQAPVISEAPDETAGDIL